MAVEPTTTPPAHDVLNQEESREERPQEEEQYGPSPSQLLEPDPEGDMLRNAPTYREDVPAAPPKRHATGATGATAAEKPKPPGLVTKVMTKLGLNDILLKSMFKYVPPSSRPACFTWLAELHY